VAFRRARVPTAEDLMRISGDDSILRNCDIQQFEAPMSSYVKCLISAATATVLLSCLATQGRAQSPPTPTNSARATIAESQAIAPGGIDELKTVDIGGIKQWISVRGNNPANPILLFIHGGPGSPMMPESWIFQRPWEDFFTVVQWDQRGAGKTFSASGRQPDKSMSLEQMQADAEQLIDLLRQAYGKKKIFLMAHSFGSVLGVRVAQHRPDALYAYIGVGQVVNAVQNETVGYQLTLAQAEAVGNQTAINELKAIAPYPGPGGSAITLPKISTERKWDVALGGMRYGRTADPIDAFQSLSPDYSDDDLQSAAMGNRSSAAILFPELLAVNFDNISSFKCPVFLFAGLADRTTPSTLVEAFYNHIQAPKKKLYKIERASHDVMFDAPGEVLVDLVLDIRPLSQGNARRR
jgi:pimeloyl-ACP methyl ester carboxylesterase